MVGIAVPRQFVSTVGRIPFTERCNGDSRRRLSWQAKLLILDPDASPAVTERRLETFRRIFAFRQSGGIVTRLGQGPRAWTALAVPITLDHIVRHLLADRAESLQPQWIGARGFQRSTWICLDVDADRTSEQRFKDEYHVRRMEAGDIADSLSRLRRNNARPSFVSRCYRVETALQSFGIDVNNENEVLIQPTPSGGRHYYLFFDAAYALYQYQGVLESAGLQFAKGEIELFPSDRQGLRLPFGHLPNEQRDPKAWIRFIDYHRRGDIKRFSLQDLENTRLRLATTRSSRVPSAVRVAVTIGERRRERPSTNLPRHFGSTASPVSNAVQRYRSILDVGPKSFADVEDLSSLGILLSGTRTATLKHLAAHLIWFKGLSANAAAEQLTTWALNTRHDSKDIRDDLANGTTNVEKHIERLCSWYAMQFDDRRLIKCRPTKVIPMMSTFSLAEIEGLREHLKSIPAAEQSMQAEFYLHFLDFAKRHGAVIPDKNGWRAAPAVNAIIRKWPGCSHMQYKMRIDLATRSGAMVMIKDKWQNAKGPGRARTYLLYVPVIAADVSTFDYSTALKMLVPATRVGDTRSVDIAEMKPSNSEREIQHDGQLEKTGKRNQSQSTALRAANSGSDLDQGSRERTAKPDATARLRDPSTRPDSVIATSPFHGCGPFRNPHYEARRRGKEQSLGRLLVLDELMFIALNEPIPNVITRAATMAWQNEAITGHVDNRLNSRVPP